MPATQIPSNWSLQKPKQLVYVELGPDNGGMVLGICEQGLSFRAVGPLKADGLIDFAFAPEGKEKLQGAGEIVWLDDGAKSGGLKFANVSLQFRESLRVWLASASTPKSAGTEITPAAALPLDSIDKQKTSPRPPGLARTKRSEALLEGVDVPLTKPGAMISSEPISPAASPSASVPPVAISQTLEPSDAVVSPLSRIDLKPAEPIPQNFTASQEGISVERSVPLVSPPGVEHEPTISTLPQKELGEWQSFAPAALEPELRTAAPLPDREPASESVFSLPNFRLPSFQVVPSPPEKTVLLPPTPASPEPLPFKEVSTAEAPSHFSNVEPPPIEEAPHRRLIPPPATPAPWEEQLNQTASESEAEQESPRLNRAVAGIIISVALVVLLAAFVLSFRREVGEMLISIGQSLSGEEWKPAATQPPISSNPALNTPPQNSPSGANSNPETAGRSVPQPSNSGSASANPTTTDSPSQNTAQRSQDPTPPATSGTGQSEFEQARNLLRGNHRQKDLPAAVVLLWTGVNKGYVPAQVTLADLYARGDGVAKDCAQARVLLNTAIQKGSPEARRRLQQLKRQGCP